jgi:hypothetical protein
MTSIRLGCTDCPIPVRALRHGYSRLLQVDVGPAQPARLAGSDAGEDHGHQQGAPDDSYIDLSDANNRAKFLANNIKADGSVPTGTPPPVFKWGAAAKWSTNRGTGGNPTVHGAVA